MLRILYLLYTLGGVILVLYAFSIALNLILFVFLRLRLPALPTISVWPPVTIQLPVYNESAVIERLLQAVVRLDYPKDKLQILILDDSTDITSPQIDSFLRALSDDHLDIQVIRRKERSDYKTGALRGSMHLVKGELIAIFDADFVPPRDFLRSTIPYFANDPKLSFIQVRWGYTNSDQSFLTLIQSISLDIHFLVQKPLEQYFGLFINYNGSAGVWRKEAILDSGGWPHSALSEDLELSYRAQMKGWKVLYLPQIVVPSELIPSVYLLGIQQERWAFGALQVFSKLWPDLLIAKVSLYRRIHALSTLIGYGVFVLFVLQPVFFTTLSLFASRPPGWPLCIILILSAIYLLYGVLALKQVYVDWIRRSFYVPLYILMTIGFSIRVSWGTISGILHRKYEFSRTPKFGTSSNSPANIVILDQIKQLSWYKWIEHVLTEVLVSMYLLIGVVFFLRESNWGLALLLGVFVVCYSGVAISTSIEMKNQKRSAS